jgi:ABC-type nitrate/sulfonate/bicarbonate transport system permease component
MTPNGPNIFFNTGMTLWSVFLGLLLGGIPGLLLGLIMGWSHRLYRLINPLGLFLDLTIKQSYNSQP